MRKCFYIFATAIFLSGCAGGGVLVPTGTMNYGKLSNALRCEIEDVFEYDRTSLDSPNLFYSGDERKPTSRRARVAVKINGHFERNGSLNADLSNYSLGDFNTVSAGIGASRSLTDQGAVVLGYNIKPEDDRKCDPTYVQGYDLSKLGLLAWYKKVSSRITDPRGTSFVSQLSYVQTGKFVLGKNYVRFSLFAPTKLGPSIDFTNSQTAEITIVFDKPSGNDVVELGDETLQRLAELIRSEGKNAGPRRVSPRSETPEDLLYDRQLDKLNEKFETLIEQ